MQQKSVVLGGESCPIRGAAPVLRKFCFIIILLRRMTPLSRISWVPLAMWRAYTVVIGRIKFVTVYVHVASYSV